MVEVGTEYNTLQENPIEFKISRMRKKVVVGLRVHCVLNDGIVASVANRKIDVFADVASKEYSPIGGVII